MRLGPWRGPEDEPVGTDARRRPDRRRVGAAAPGESSRGGERSRRGLEVRRLPSSELVLESQGRAAERPCSGGGGTGDDTGTPGGDDPIGAGGDEPP